MNLYFITWHNDDGENFDWFVREQSFCDAINNYCVHVNEYEGLKQSEENSWEITYRGYSKATQNDAVVFVVPYAEGPAGPVEWDHTISYYATMTRKK